MAEFRKRVWDAFLTIPGLLDWGAKAWPLIASLGGASAMTLLARASSGINKFGPIGWGAVGLGSFALIYGLLIIGSSLTARASEKKALAILTIKSAEAGATNPSNIRYERKSLRLIDFYHPFFRHRVRQTFVDSEVYGPGNMAFIGTPAFLHCEFFDCDTVIVQPGRKCYTSVIFDSPTFERCRFFRITIFLTPPDYLQMTMNGGKRFQIVAGETYLPYAQGAPSGV